MWMSLILLPLLPHSIPGMVNANWLMNILTFTHSVFYWIIVGGKDEDTTSIWQKFQKESQNHGKCTCRKYEEKKSFMKNSQSGHKLGFFQNVSGCINAHNKEQSRPTLVNAAQGSQWHVHFLKISLNLEHLTVVKTTIAYMRYMKIYFQKQLIKHPWLSALIDRVKFKQILSKLVFHIFCIISEMWPS